MAKFVLKSKCRSKNSEGHQRED